MPSATEPGFTPDRLMFVRTYSAERARAFFGLPGDWPVEEPAALDSEGVGEFGVLNPDWRQPEGEGR